MDPSDALTIDVSQLRAVLDGLLRHVESEYGTHVSFDQDHYWLVELGAAFSDDLHEPGEKADHLGVGQISDDVESVAETARHLRRGRTAVSLWHDLEHAVGLLRALAFIDLPWWRGISVFGRARRPQAAK